MPDHNDTDDVVALWRLQARYADVITRRAWPELHDLFLADTAVHIDTVSAPLRTVVGPEAFGAFVAGAIARFDHFAFVILNTVVEVTSTEEARGRIFMCEVRHDAASDTWPNAHGVYEDRYVRRADRWWIAERHYRSMARTGAATEIVGLPPGLGPMG